MTMKAVDVTAEKYKISTGFPREIQVRFIPMVTIWLGQCAVGITGNGTESSPYSLTSR